MSKKHKSFYLVLLLLLPAVFCYSHPLNRSDTLASSEKLQQAFTFHLINDNYIATWLPGEKGHYFGADDFLTGSLSLNYYHDSWQHSLLFNALTLRHFNLRYDLLSFLTFKKYYMDDFIFTPAAGFIFKGEFGGDQFQNGYHKFRDIKRVRIPYSSDKGLGVIVSLKTAWKKKDVLWDCDNLQLSLELKIYSDHVASHFTPGLSYQSYLWNDLLQVDLLLASRKYINQVREYSEMVNSGMIYGINTKVNFYGKYYFDIGFITIPTQNIKSDPVYPKYNNDYLPQVWIGISWQSAGLRISDFIIF